MIGNLRHRRRCAESLPTYLFMLPAWAVADWCVLDTELADIKRWWVFLFVVSSIYKLFGSVAPIHTHTHIYIHIRTHASNTFIPGKSHCFIFRLGHSATFLLIKTFSHLKAMCNHTPIDKTAVPCMWDVDGITSMPVRFPSSFNFQLSTPRTNTKKPVNKKITYLLTHFHTNRLSPQVPGRRCPACLERGDTVWVIPGKCCPQCGTPVN